LRRNKPAAKVMDNARVWEKIAMIWGFAATLIACAGISGCRQGSANHAGLFARAMLQCD
jgi:hypothetical protein